MVFLFNDNRTCYNLLQACTINGLLFDCPCFVFIFLNSSNHIDNANKTSKVCKWHRAGKKESSPRQERQREGARLARQTETANETGAGDDDDDDNDDDDNDDNNGNDST